MHINLHYITGCEQTQIHHGIVYLRADSVDVRASSKGGCTLTLYVTPEQARAIAAAMNPTPK